LVCIVSKSTRPFHALAPHTRTPPQLRAARLHDTVAAPRRTPWPLAPRAERRLFRFAMHTRTPPPPLQVARLHAAAALPLLAPHARTTPL